jgi:kynurenine formamidase
VDETSKYDGRGAESPKWFPSRYGPDDRAGAANELTPERTLAALQVPTAGDVIELAQPVDAASPALPPRKFQQLILNHGSDSELLQQTENDLKWLEELIVAPAQIGCHVDGLGHIGIGGHFYNGVHYRDFCETSGLTQFGAETLPSWVCRGVLLDVAAMLGQSCLPAGFEITGEHLEACSKSAETEVRAGDAVLVRTGWGPLWHDDPVKYHREQPGVGWDGAHWLTNRRVALVGADNWGFEHVPFADDKQPFVVHQHLLTECGTYILENITLDELALRRRSEFLFALSAPKLCGATAGPASPVAVV